MSSAIAEEWLLQNKINFKKHTTRIRQAMSMGTSLGRVSLTIKIGPNQKICKFLVIRNLSQSMLIGLDIIRSFGLEQRSDGIYQKHNNNYFKVEDKDELNQAINYTEITEARRNTISPYDLIPPSEFDLEEECFCQDSLRGTIEEFSELFRGLGENNKIKHKIELTADKPIKIYRRIPHHSREKVEDHIQELLRGDIIEESISDYCSPIVPIKKKDGTMRLAVDYGRLNSISKKDVFPMPRIDELIDNLGKAKVFSKIDLVKGYYQIALEDDSKHLTAFSWNKKLYQFKRMPFGLVTAPQTFQRLMTRILGDLEFVQCYLDDVVVYSKNLDEHRRHLRTVLKRFQEENLKLNKKKCQFGTDEISFLGFQIKNGAKSIPNDKIKAIVDYPRPQTKRELHKFVGMANFYRALIPNFSDMSKPLYDIINQRKFIWNEAGERNFALLKKKLTTFPVVHIPDLSKKFIVTTDASDIAMGAVLMQEIDGHKRVIEYASKTLDKAQRNYSTIEKEANSIIFALKKWQVYLEGKPFSIESDHKPLTWLVSKKDCTGKLARWALLLQEFDIEEIRHIKGEENVVADALSRIEINLLEHEQDRELPNIDNIETINGKKYLIENNKKRLVITSREDQELIVRTVHDEFGHLGLYKCSSLIRERFYWKNWKKELKSYIKKCERCQTRADDKESKEPMVLRNAHLLKPWQQLSIDICGPFAESNRGKKYLLLGQDLFTKFVVGKAVKEIKSSDVCNWLIEVARSYGYPEEIMVDQGTQFESRQFKSFCQENNVKIHVISTYHHQSNGQIERFNRTIEKMIRTTISNQREWCSVVDKMLLSYNVTTQCSTKVSPWKALYGTIPKTKLDEDWPTLRDDSNEEVTNQEIRKNLEKSQESAKKYYDRVIKPSRCTIGSKVWWHCHEQGREKSKKLNVKWQGPFRVVKIEYPLVILEDAEHRTKKIHLNHVKACQGEGSLGFFRFRGRPRRRRGGVGAGNAPTPEGIEMALTCLVGEAVL